MNSLKPKNSTFFFASVGQCTYEETQSTLASEGHNINFPSTRVINNELFPPQPVDVSTVVLTIKQLQATKCFGSDLISLKFIQDCITAHYLTTIINTSIVTGIFPESWKHALVVPILKHGDAADVSNYRPISLLPILSKVLEKTVSTQLVHYLEANKLLSKNQHGFRPKLSTATALTVVTDEIFKNMDSKKVSLLSLCDLSKAFDSVNHNILLEKLQNTAVDKFWFDDYIKGRTQSVRLNNTVSSKTTTRYGVPSGSILRPVLFNVYVNDMSSHFTNCLLVQYADDTQFLHTGEVEELNTLVLEAETTLSRARHFFSHKWTKAQCEENTMHLLRNSTVSPPYTCRHHHYSPQHHIQTL